MKKISFTLIEVLISMAIIGIVAGAIANSIKNVSANKTKIAFKNCYTHMTRTLDNIYSDGEIFSRRYGTSQSDISMCRCNWKEFVDAFKDLTLVDTWDTTKSFSNGWGFTTKQGSYWVVRRNPNIMHCYITDVNDIDNADFWIIFDIDGPNKGSNCPYYGDDLNSENSSCTSPDTFKFGLTETGKILPDTKTYYNDMNLKDYMEDNYFIKDKF